MIKELDVMNLNVSGSINMFNLWESSGIKFLHPNPADQQINAPKGLIADQLTKQ